MQRTTFLFTYGFALFAMFFGSGNLVFPLQIGSLSGVSWLLGFSGLLITGVLLPFLGLFVIKLYKGSYYNFFGEAGTLARIVLPLFTLSLLGSFGVVPRCITVAHGGIAYLYPEIPLITFSLIFCCLTYLICIKDKFMIDILGKWMSPILLATLFILIILGIVFSPDLIGEKRDTEVFIHGFITGYQTMDLFAAFFFAAIIFTQMQQHIPSSMTPKESLKYALKPSILGALLLGLVYMGLVFLGAHYSDLIKDVEPEAMLPTIAEYTLGGNATLFISTAMLLSCVTTAVALNNIYARYICSALNLEYNRFPLILLGTTAVSFIISMLDFKGIAAFLAPALEVSYPGIIALTVMSIATKDYRGIKIAVFYLIVLVTLIKMFLEV